MKAFAHTFSIIARDPETGQFGIGVQSHWFGVGALVPWSETGIGAVATQAMAETSYGRLGLDLMRAGLSAEQALNGLTCADPDNHIRQVAMIDKEGRTAVHTGSRCIEHAGHKTGEQYCALGNLLANNDIWNKMGEAYETAKGDFSERLLQALEAGQDAGGDARGKQSAALLVVPGPDDPIDHIFITNLRVDDSRQPLLDLRKLLTVQRSYEWHERAIHAVHKGEMEEARKHYAKLRGVAIGTREPLFWYATALAEKGHMEEALPIFAEVFKVEPIWKDMIDRFVAKGFFPEDKKIVKEVKAI